MEFVMFIFNVAVAVVVGSLIFYLIERIGK